MMLTRIEKFAMEFLGGGFPGCVGFFLCGEAAEADDFAVNTDLGLEPVYFAVNAFQFSESPPFGRSTVPALLLARGCAQIAPAIVQSNAVDVIDAVFWPFASHYSPCDEMCMDEHIVYLNSEIVVSFGATCFGPTLCSSVCDVPSCSNVAVVSEMAARAPSPEEFSHMWVIDERFADNLDGRQSEFTWEHSHWLRSDLDQWSGPAWCFQHHSGPPRMIHTFNEVN